MVLLFAEEPFSSFIRAHAVRKNRPITLQITSSSPQINEDTESGLYYLTSLFRPLDETFFAVWNDSVQSCTKEWLLQLECNVRTTLPPILDVSNEEIANIRISQLWLQIKLWELFPRFGFLSTESMHECLTFRYPISVAKDLTMLAIKLPIQSLRVHGVGMVRRLWPKFALLLTFSRPRRCLTSRVPLLTFSLSCHLHHLSLHSTLQIT